MTPLALLNFLLIGAAMWCLLAMAIGGMNCLLIMAGLFAWVLAGRIFDGLY